MIRALISAVCLVGCTTTVDPNCLRSLGYDVPTRNRMIEGARGNGVRLEATTRIRAYTPDGWTESTAAHRIKISNDALHLGKREIPWELISELEVTNSNAGLYALAPLALPLTWVAWGAVQFVPPELVFYALAVPAYAVKEELDKGPKSLTAKSNPPGPSVPLPLLTEYEARRGRFGISLSADVGFALKDQDGFFQGGALTLRLGNVAEVGLGYRHTHASEEGGNALIHRHEVFGRLGASLPIDEGRRFSLPLIVDIGGGPRTQVFIRFMWGLRWRIFDELHATLFLVNPTYSRLRATDPDPTDRFLPEIAEEARFPSGVELAYTF